MGESCQGSLKKKRPRAQTQNPNCLFHSAVMDVRWGKGDQHSNNSNNKRKIQALQCDLWPRSRRDCFFSSSSSSSSSSFCSSAHLCFVWKISLQPDYYHDADQFVREGDGPIYQLNIPCVKLDYTGAYTVIARNVHGEAKAIISLQVKAGTCHARCFAISDSLPQNGGTSSTTGPSSADVGHRHWRFVVTNQLKCLFWAELILMYDHLSYIMNLLSIWMV